MLFLGSMHLYLFLFWKIIFISHLADTCSEQILPICKLKCKPSSPLAWTIAISPQRFLCFCSCSFAIFFHTITRGIDLLLTWVTGTASPVASNLRGKLKRPLTGTLKCQQEGQSSSSLGRATHQKATLTKVKSLCLPTQRCHWKQLQNWLLFRMQKRSHVSYLTQSKVLTL